MPRQVTTRSSPLLDRVHSSVLAHADRCALAGPAGEITYAAMWGLVGDWAARLTALAPSAAPSAALLVVADPAYLPVGVLAARAAGLVPVLVDPAQGAERRDVMAALTRPAVEVVLKSTPRFDRLYPDPMPLPAEAGYIGFTSGTQGTPKAIVGHEHGVEHFVDWELGVTRPGPGSTVAMISPPTFEVIYRELYLGLLSGARLRIAEPGVRLDVRRILAWVAEHDVEILHAVPSLAMRWLTAPVERRAERLRWTLFAGEPLYAGQVELWRDFAPRSRVVNLYGPSETTMAKFSYRVPDPPRPGLQPVGRPLPGTTLVRMPLPDGPGFRVRIDTPYGSLGYLPGTAAPDEDACLVRAGGITSFVSQDRGRLNEDGELVVEGRLDTQVKRRGVFVDVAAVERTVTGVDGVLVACCVQLGPDRGGEVVLAVEDGPALDLPGVRRTLRRALGTAGPDRLVLLPEIPLSANGKIDRRWVARAVAEE